MGVDKQLDNIVVPSKSNPPTVIVIGNGPVGVHFVNQLINAGWQGQIKIFGEEPDAPYNRVMLSSFLGGEVSFEGIQSEFKPHYGLIQHVNCKVTSIDTDEKVITDQFGTQHAFDSLVIATGSRPYIPKIKGVDTPGVFQFRSLKDTTRLFARQVKSRHCVVVGGGLLGLESAKAMLRHSTRVTVIQHTAHILNRQLDETGAERLQAFAESIGINFVLNRSIKSIDGDDEVEAITLDGGECISCDTVIFATGISPAIELAETADLNTRKGILIDNLLQTSSKNIYAIGECSDHNNQIFGIVAPGLAQANVLAANLMGAKREYTGAVTSTQLKVVGCDVFSAGTVTDEFKYQVGQSLIFENDTSYIRLFLRGNKLIGAVAVGPCNYVKSLQQAVEQEKYLWPWDKWKFTKTGELFDSPGDSYETMPNSTIICNCQQVTLGQIKACLNEKSNSPDALASELGVGTMCGTCKPIAQQICAAPIEKLPVKTVLMALSIIATILAVCILALPKIPAPTSVQIPTLSWLWTESQWRQTSGFTMLGLTALTVFLSFRKRWKKFSIGKFDMWRLIHVLVTTFALATLFAHTGISLGEGVNRWLIINFLLIALVGGASAAIAAIEGAKPTMSVKRAKRFLVNAHIVVFWPLPVLLAFHILSVYYF
ncbi:MAG: FAD-dependent oxidoreductase [Pseudomonadota bacterium]